MIQAVKITAYKCPFCDCVSTDKTEIETHALKCYKNPDYTQKCINCGSLDKDFVFSDLCGRGICLFTRPSCGGCPYVNHDSEEVDLKIQQSHDAYTKFYNYDSSISPQENWRKEEEYDRLRSSGVTADEAKRRIYG